MAGTVSRRDPLTTIERSARMSRVRSTGNRSTELLVETVLRGSKNHRLAEASAGYSWAAGFLFSQQEVGHLCRRMFLARVPSMRAADTPCAPPVLEDKAVG